MKPLLTIFTPTYNRAHLLPRLYASLLRQTNQDFTWLVIDDGSVDNTRELVAGWIAENRIPIQYYYQENQGMHGAHNSAYALADTELCTCVDSDDWMTDDAVEKITVFWEKNGSDKFSGFLGLDIDPNGSVIGTQFPDSLKASTLFDLYHKFGIKGDKKGVCRTHVFRQYPYPLFPGENYVGLSYKYHMIDLEYKLLLLNEPLCVVDYQPDGSSYNMLSQYRRNPNGFRFLRKTYMIYPQASVFFRFKQATHYIAESIIVKKRSFLQESPRKLLTLAAILPGVMLYFYIMHTKTALPFKGK